MPGVIRPDEDAQGEEIFLGGAGQVARIVATGGHVIRIRDGSSTMDRERVE